MKTLKKNYREGSDKEHIFEVDADYPKNLNYFHSDLPFLPERIKINKCSKLVCNFCDKITMLYIGDH